MEFPPLPNLVESSNFNKSAKAVKFFQQIYGTIVLAVNLSQNAKISGKSYYHMTVGQNRQ